MLLKKNKPYYFILFLFLNGIACKKSYEPAVIQIDNNFLVIDGFINTGVNAESIFTLSRTKKLNDTISFIPETGAAVYIDEIQGASFNLYELPDGVYKSIPLLLNPASGYRLRIITSNNNVYESDFVKPKITPPIDSITWEQQNDIIIAVNTNDPQNETKYYKWDYTETWKYNTILSTPYTVMNRRIVVKDPASQKDSCWQTENSKNLILTTTLPLNQDVVSNFPITTITNSDKKISERYSILLKQQAINQEAYQYFRVIQKNTEQLGTLFDVQPSELSGNIKCVTIPGQPVIGFVYACTEETKRIFINNSELSNWNTPPLSIECNQLLIAPNTDPFVYDYPDPDYAPYYFISGGPLVIAKKICLDCEKRGGTAERPVFW